MSESQKQSALYKLRDQIIRGVLRGGDKLRASHLAETMDISRTPINEVLLQLHGEGLLIRDKSGFTVRSFSLQDVKDAIDLRGVLEGAAAQIAAEKGVAPTRLLRLRGLLKEMDEAVESGKTSAYDHLNANFHTELVACSESPIFVEEAMRSYRLPFAAPSAFPTRESDEKKFLNSIIIGQAQHHRIVQALEARQGARVFALLREHALLARRNVDRAVESNYPMPQLAMLRG